MLRLKFSLQQRGLRERRAEFAADLLDPMRLDPHRAELIRAVLRRRFGDACRTWLFGSRLDEPRQGGDLDLYIEPERIPGGNVFLAQQAAKRDLERLLRCPVALIVRRERETAFMRSAKRQGIPP